MVISLYTLAPLIQYAESIKEDRYMTIEEMIRRKNELGLTNEEIARRSGVPVGTVQKIFGGFTQSPRYRTLQALEAVLKPDENVPVYADSGDRNAQENVNPQEKLLCEEQAAFGDPGQGHYTLSDYYKLPDDRRAELIDGVFYDMTAPHTDHQMILGQIYTRLLSCITEHHLNCIPFIAPTDVQLDCDEKTMLEPDVFVVCDRKKITKSHIYGAPDMAVEILSASTRKKDMNLKNWKYQNAGVREYWIVDPMKEKIIVYLYGDQPDISIYSFQDKVPVAISGGLCSIDFQEISAYIHFDSDN